MSNTAHFKVFCLERYKSQHHMKGEEVINLFIQYDVFDYLTNFYDVLHSFGEKYIVANIDEFISSRQTA
ncbi:MAG: DUF3791 domain-containing protein [Oscillospiraceae bacterium]|nr:DUF3791 domain-containing protein [Oscillospiraceae bacterium]